MKLFLQYEAFTNAWPLLISEVQNMDESYDRIANKYKTKGFIDVGFHFVDLAWANGMEIGKDWFKFDIHENSVEEPDSAEECDSEDSDQMVIMHKNYKTNKGYVSMENTNYDLCDGNCVNPTDEQMEFFVAYYCLKNQKKLKDINGGDIKMIFTDIMPENHHQVIFDQTEDAYFIIVRDMNTYEAH